MEVLCLVQEGLSNQEIARALHLSLETVKWHNQQIFAKLQVRNRTQAVQKARLYGLIDLKPASSRWEPAGQKHNLPAPLDNFIGRNTELDELCSLLRDEQQHLVTLAGPGGVGKTRLAIQAGWGLRGSFPDGVFFVSLASTRETHLVIPSIAAALNLHEIPHHTLADLLKEHLRHKRLLLILDNFEQVLPAGLLVCELLVKAPGLKILVTSREILRLTGEQVYSLPPLSLPRSDGAVSTQDVQETEAVQLFASRARAVRPDFRLSDENVDAVVEICSRLDGLPLAIELAAARSRLMTPKEMLAQFDHRLRLLVGGVRDLPDRQQSLRASLEWSHSLLSPVEQVLFRRMAVFAGGCTLEAAEAVCAQEGLEVVSGIESLLDKHLLHRTEVGGGSRFDMYETVREFALDCLERSGESPLIHRKWAYFYCEWRERNNRYFKLLDTEINNFRAVMRWSIDSGDVEPGFRITQNAWYWASRNAEWQYWLDSLLESPGARSPSGLKMWVLHHAFLQALCVPNYSRCRKLADQFQAMAVELNDPGAIITVHYQTGYLYIGRGDFEAACAAFSEAVTKGRKHGDSFLLANYLRALGVCLLLQQQYDCAEEALGEALEIFEQIPFPTCAIEALTNLGYVALAKKEFSRSKQYFAQSIDRAQEIGFDAEQVDCLNGLAGIALSQGDCRKAAQLYAAAEVLVRRFGSSTHEAPLMILKEQYQSHLRKQLEPAIVESAWQEGQVMTMEEALAYGLESSSG